MDNLNYGIIGNCKSAALISDKGSLDWCCLPIFDSPSVFAKLLDEEKGGSQSFEVSDAYTITQQYMWQTNILRTMYDNGTDAFEVFDFMPRYEKRSGSFYAPPDIIRFIRLVKGAPKFVCNYDPKLEYASTETITVNKGEYIESYTNEGKYDSLYLYTNLEKEAILNKKEITLDGNAFLLMSYHEKLMEQTLDRAYLKFQRTKVYWMNWSEATTKYPLYQNEIMRSALTLKALTFEKSGAVLAAAIRLNANCAPSFRFPLPVAPSLACWRTSPATAARTSTCRPWCRSSGTACRVRIRPGSRGRTRSHHRSTARRWFQPRYLNPRRASPHRPCGSRISAPRRGSRTRSRPGAGSSYNGRYPNLEAGSRSRR